MAIQAECLEWRVGSSNLLRQPVLDEANAPVNGLTVTCEVRDRTSGALVTGLTQPLTMVEVGSTGVYEVIAAASAAVMAGQRLTWTVTAGTDPGQTRVFVYDVIAVDG